VSRGCTRVVGMSTSERGGAVGERGEYGEHIAVAWPAAHVTKRRSLSDP